MLQPASLRLWGTFLGYLGVALMVFWIASLIWRQGNILGGGSAMDTLERVPPLLWLLIPVAGVPGFLIHLAGDKIEAQREHISVREVQFRRHLKLSQPKSKHATDK